MYKQAKTFNVSELSYYIKNLLESDRYLSNLWVRGEISNFKHHPSGHMYFTLKDEGSALKCVMFRGRNQGLRFAPQNGMGVLARGSVSLYERDGQYQLYVEEMQPDGVGALHLAFEQLKEKLQKEGLFDHRWKKPIPVLPRRIGIVTSPTGAAIRDILTVIERRFPYVEIVLSPVAVQGESAPEEIAKGIRVINDFGGIDVMIVGRGGGSLEELWAFNTEVVAKAIFASQVPVISGVGHEVDFTIADFVADARAATPSAAAEIAVPHQAELLQRVGSFGQRLVLAMGGYLQKRKNRLEMSSRHELLRSPKNRLLRQAQTVDFLSQKLNMGLEKHFTGKNRAVEVLAGKLQALSPLATLARGYSICRDKQGHVLVEAGQVETGSEVEIILKKGLLISRVVDKKEDGYEG